MYTDEFNLHGTCEQLTLEVSRWKACAKTAEDRLRFIQHRVNEVEADLRDAEVLLASHRKFEAAVIEGLFGLMAQLNEAQVAVGPEPVATALDRLVQTVADRLKEQQPD
jgi:hypothetical protein